MTDRPDAPPPPAWVELGAVLALTLGGVLLRGRGLAGWPLDALEMGAVDRLLDGSIGRSPTLLVGGFLLDALGDPALAVRALPLVAGAISIPLLYALTRRLAGGWPAIAAAGLLAFCPLHAHASSRGSDDATFMLLAGGACLVGACLARGLGSGLGIVLGVLLAACAFQAGAGYGSAPVVAELPLDLGLALPVLLALGLHRQFRQGHAARWALAIAVLLPILLEIAAPVGDLEGIVLAAVLPALALAGVGLGALLEVASLRVRLGTAALALIPVVPLVLSNLADNRRYQVPAVLASLDAVRQPGEPVLAEAHRIAEYYSGRRCQELPDDDAELRRLLPTNRRAFVLMFLQQGRAVGLSDPEMQGWVESRMRLLDREAPRRFDRHRFETRLYLWTPPKSSPPESPR